jgi:pilus assembly protein Flp/PilA
MGERSMSMFRRFVKDESGATAIEYGLIAALVSVAIIAALGMVGDNLTATFQEVSTQLSGATGG